MSDYGIRSGSYLIRPTLAIGGCAGLSTLPNATTVGRISREVTSGVIRRRSGCTSSPTLRQSGASVFYGNQRLFNFRATRADIHTHKTRAFLAKDNAWIHADFAFFHKKLLELHIGEFQL